MKMSEQKREMVIVKVDGSQITMSLYDFYKQYRDPNDRKSWRDYEQVRNVITMGPKRNN